MAPQDRNHRSAAQTLQVLKICPKWDFSGVCPTPPHLSGYPHTQANEPLTAFFSMIP